MEEEKTMAMATVSKYKVSIYIVKPVHNGHSIEKQKVAVKGR